MVSVTVDQQEEVWKKPIKRLTRVDKEWSDKLEEGPISSVEEDKLQSALKHVKNGKIHGSSHVVTKMLKVEGKICLKGLTNIFNKALFRGKLPNNWLLCLLLPLFNACVCYFLKT